MDFIRAAYKEDKLLNKEWYPSLQALESTDLVIRGGSFVAIWDQDTGLYSRRQSHVPDIIDRSFMGMIGDRLRAGDTVKKVRAFDNQIFSRLQGLIRNIGDMGPELDQKIIFADEIPQKRDAASFKMPYALTDAPCPTWDRIISHLYEPSERLKIEWAIGAIFTGASIDEVQKFYVFYGPPGSGKSTILNIIEKLFEGHVSHFSAYDMAKADAQFSLEPFSKNPLVSVDQDADLSRIELNKNLNSIVSHDRVLINSKGKNLFEIKPRTTLFIGTNEPVKISNRKSGLFRRLVDIQPSGNVFPEDEYHQLMRQVEFEMGAIAQHCINVFRDHGSTYLSSYRSTDMMYRTNDVFNFVQDHRMILEKGLTLKQAHKMYLAWCTETETKNIYKQFQFRDLLRDYFDHFHDQHMIEGVRYRSYFEGLKELEVFSWKGIPIGSEPVENWLVLDKKTSLLDELLADEKAQYSSDSGTPRKGWINVTETLKDLDTSKEHFVKVPTQHIMVDFDLTDENGEKSLEKNLEAAALWPATYAEISKSGSAIHLHYEWLGDVDRLAPLYSDGIEIKTLLGGSSLRRRLQSCNGLPVATISSGLPLKEEKVLSKGVMKSEKTLRELIIRALNKEIGAGTKTNMDFIAKITREAYDGGIVYDVSDMWDDILAFAMGSSHQRDKSLEIAMGLKLKSELDLAEETVDTDKPIAYFDCEVYPNLFAVGWIYEDAPDEQLVKMLNPTPAECQQLLDTLRLIGYNCRPYDAHILWARTLGFSNEQLYQLSQRIIVENDRRAMYGAAYNACYADIYDYASEKKSLKKWQIELGLPHKEMDLPWDQDVPEDRVLDVLDYMGNDILSTREVARARAGDFRARQILAELSGLQVINTNRQHTERLIFGGDREVSQDLVYTDLHEMFPGYRFDRFAPGKEKSTYKEESVGEGGLVRSRPGMYENVVLLDVASMHPTSIIELNLFGKYTSKFKELMDARLAIKKGDLEAAGKMFDGRLAQYVADPQEAEMLSNALKIVINSVYGLTAASFPNLFRDPSNIDNIVAKRGALFMVDLMKDLDETGYNWVHIKTDSVKIQIPKGEDPSIIVDLVTKYGKKYGYTFEHEATFERFCLVNDAVYVGKYDMTHKKKPGQWTSTGAQYLHPVVFKTLFSKEEIEPGDYVETKQVAKGHMYLVNEETDFKQFVGRFGAFVPVQKGKILLRIDGDKEHAVTGTKGFLWELDEVALQGEVDIDMTYFQELVDEGLRTIEKFGSYAEFTRV